MPFQSLAVSSWVFIAIIIIFLVSRYTSHPKGRSLPPGPRPILFNFIGNIFDIPLTRPWECYREMSQEYGPIVCLQAMGHTLLVVNDADTAISLLDKNSASYSSRQSSFATGVLGSEWNMPLMQYGSPWRRRRRVMAQHFHSAVVSKFQPIQEASARDLLSRLLVSPDDLKENTRYSLGASILHAAYGIEVAPSGDRYVKMFEEVIQGVDLLLASPTMFVINALPFLARIPTWLPGTGIQRRMAHMQRLAITIRDVPWADTKKAIMTGDTSGGIVGDILLDLAQKDVDPDDEELIGRDAMTSTYIAGLDTQSATLISFFLAMSLYPDVQRKAQAELDAVVGPDRLPQFSDRDALPYVNAIVKECLRWHVVLPLGLPHCTTTDTEYHGYFIPKDTLVLVNVWSILHDPVTYPEPDKFVPERFLKDNRLNPETKDPEGVVYGFGRRICPGRFFAENTLFISIACVLHTLSITPPLDAGGQSVPVQPRATTGIVSHIEDSRCSIRARSASAERLIRG